MKTIVITGTRKGIGKSLAEYYLENNWRVAGCSRGASSIEHPDYTHFELDVSDESAVSAMASSLKKSHGGVDALLNNAGIASMNHALLTPGSTVRRIFDTNVIGSFLFCREMAKLMRKSDAARIVNFTTVAHPLNLEGEAIYAASKAAVESLTRILAKELAALRITVNAIGPTPIATDLIRGVPQAKMDALIAQQAIPRMGTVADVINMTDFFLRPESDFVTGQIMYLGGVC
ncbi:SDR family NAD(P)-dependent oxidoreductase [Coraliomargarita akajimensis]|uniref:Short-chain dehydrogenase/reductase SDR n=1 Tax=Coraliomargarita akajimensis (strain DSM 45221 / IAM 15411 / JCM 23193 / KCTC 12865 / 04OKA010-24) TaxID=583355 RepID=D5EN03_CORAD|nr:SDR family oxidoreductase [Coraliomargarita akajimensis]ADE55393.1 short-chain dehydrogenase/reductase SDR [Coraliomargarita akajimensis DSM 45221]